MFRSLSCCEGGAVGNRAKVGPPSHSAATSGLCASPFSFVKHSSWRCMPGFLIICICGFQEQYSRTHAMSLSHHCILLNCITRYSPNPPTRDRGVVSSPNNHGIHITNNWVYHHTIFYCTAVPIRYPTILLSIHIGFCVCHKLPSLFKALTRRSLCLKKTLLHYCPLNLSHLCLLLSSGFRFGGLLPIAPNHNYTQERSNNG